MQHKSYTLECTPGSFQPRRSGGSELKILAADEHGVARCKRLWSGVGAGFWTERARWGPDRWVAHLRQPEVSFWIALASGEEAGCFELTRLTRGTRLEGFGLLPAYRGRGLGRDLLTEATERAFATGARKVWLHTATDDHAHALANYRSGGYRIVRERELRNPMPPQGAGEDGAPRGGGAC